MLYSLIFVYNNTIKHYQKYLKYNIKLIVFTKYKQKIYMPSENNPYINQFLFELIIRILPKKLIDSIRYDISKLF